VRYFQKEWHFAWNDFSKDSYERNLRAAKEQKAAFQEYWKHLEGLRERISPELFRVLRHPDEAHLPYARLINFAMTDYALGSAFSVTKRTRRPKPQVTLELQAEDGGTMHHFNFRRIQKLSVDFPSSEPFGSYPFTPEGLGEMIFEPEKEFGTVYICELTAVDDEVLSFELILSTGGTIAIQFREITYTSRVS
jgi:hypothetical protein